MNTGLSSWIMDGQRAQYMNIGAPVSPELTWERTTSVNEGLDMGFLDNRLTASLDIYERRTLDMLIAGKTLPGRSEEHTSELQSLMRNSYAVFCLKKKTIHTHQPSI